MITIALYKMKHAMHLPSVAYFTKVAKEVFAFCHQKGDYTLSLAFVDDAEMAGLNERWLQRKGPTDVLSFSGEPPCLGEVIINLDMIKRVITERKLSLRPVLVRYLTHGILSLLGMDHKEGEHAFEIQALEDNIVQSIV